MEIQCNYTHQPSLLLRARVPASHTLILDVDGSKVHTHKAELGGRGGERRKDDSGKKSIGLYVSSVLDLRPYSLYIVRSFHFDQTRRLAISYYNEPSNRPWLPQQNLFFPFFSSSSLVLPFIYSSCHFTHSPPSLLLLCLHTTLARNSNMLYDQQCQQSFEIAHSLTWIGLRTSGLACLYVNGQKIQSGMIGYVVTIKVPHLRILFELVEVDEHQN